MARAALEAWVREHGTVEEAAASHPGAETLRGRGRVYVVPAPVGARKGGGEPERWVVRHYRRGGAIATILGDRYLRVRTPRPLREFRVGRQLEERGVPTPEHIGAAVYPAGIWYRGDVVTRYVPGSRDLAAVLFPGRSLRPDASGNHATALGAGRSARPTTAMRMTGRLFRRLHEAGVHHPDLNLKNILIAGRDDALDALVLDLDGATLGRVSARARRRMIARFFRSARKWQRVTGIELGGELTAAFHAGYG